MKERIGILGGSFNPPHVGHVLLGTYAWSVLGLDRVIVVPSFAHPFARTLVSFEHRLRMCELAFALPFVEVSDIESRLPAPNYTVDVLEALQKLHPNADFFLILGEDTRATFSTWHRSAELAEKAQPFFVRRLPAGGVQDEASTLSTVAIAQISATEIRARLQQGLPIDSYVPDRVRKYLVAYAQELDFSENRREK